ncbi:hypothetical protein EXIGLDRAFT_364402 [Exidia glandulosa HHB12029]|uniref:Nucleoporin Nup188 N-terminal domain-containing protein n=1 Tax=Exidia glandulosa HHB12029 TaxID=1314781 RepID=A0A165C4B7_EXIGL|nr:hypothetical protein EXIGLDRAFT_364402 [Exidia glandulosa HHB12029]
MATCSVGGRQGSAQITSSTAISPVSPFYFTESLSVLRCYIPLLRAKEDVDDPLHDVAAQFLDKVLQDPAAFVRTLAKEYVQCTQKELPLEVLRDMSIATMWSKQHALEQLVMLEVLFRLAWNLVPASGPVVVQLVQTAYETDLGQNQLYVSLLLQDEGAEILQDVECVWLVLLVEAFNLEKVLEDDTLKLVAFHQDASTILSASQQLALVHNLVVCANDPRYGPITLAWACVLFRPHTAAEEQDAIPENYEAFIHRIAFVPESDPPMPLYHHILMWALHSDVDVLRRLETLLNQLGARVTSLAWISGSALTEPNAIAFRAIVEGT